MSWNGQPASALLQQSAPSRTARLAAGPKQWLGLSLLLLVCLLAAMDLGVLYLAVPSISAELAPSSTQQLWIMDIYGLVLAGLLLPMGALGDRIGRRKLLLIGAAGFAVASITASMSTDAGTLIAARALLGIAGATLMPCTFALARAMFADSQQRRMAIAVLTGATSSGAALGPLAGAFLLDHFWWGSVFLISVPAIALLLVAGPSLLPETRGAGTRTFDLIGAVLSLGAVLMVVYGVKDIGTGGPSLLPFVCIGLGLALGAGFLRRQAKQHEPLFDPRLLRNRGFATAVMLNVLTMFVMMGFTQFTFQYLQVVAGLDPWESALWSLPAPAGMLIAVSIAAMLAKTIRPSLIIATGLIIAALGMAVLTQVEADSPLTLVIAGATLLSTGVGMALGLIADLIISTAPRNNAGAAAAMSETGKELGGALGTAVLGIIGAAAYTGFMEKTLPSGLPAEAQDAASETIGGAAGVTEHLPAPLGQQVLESAQQAFAQQMNAAAIAAGAALIGATILSLAVLRRPAAADGNATLRVSIDQHSENQYS